MLCDLKQFHLHATRIARKKHNQWLSFSFTDQQLQEPRSISRQTYNHSIPIGKPLSHLTATVEHLMDLSISKNTHTVYNCALRLYKNVMVLYSILKINDNTLHIADEQQLLNFVAFCSEQHLRYQTVKIAATANIPDHLIKTLGR